MVIQGERGRQVKALRWKGKRARAAHNNLILLRNVFFLHVTFLRLHNIHTGEQQMVVFGRRGRGVKARRKREGGDSPPSSQCRCGDVPLWWRLIILIINGLGWLPKIKLQKKITELQVFWDIYDMYETFHKYMEFKLLLLFFFRIRNMFKTLNLSLNFKYSFFYYLPCLVQTGNFPKLCIWAAGECVEAYSGEERNTNLWVGRETDHLPALHPCPADRSLHSNRPTLSPSPWPSWKFT